MPARPLFWLTVFFMLGISADRLFGQSLPVQTRWYALAALVLIAATAAALWSRNRSGGRKPVRPFIHSPVHRFTAFVIPALLFVIF